MSAATVERPLPQCSAPAPTPPRCGWCDGGIVDDPDFGEIACLGCGGTGEGDWIAPAELMLDPTHTHKKPGQRRAVYDPNTKRLAITQGRKTQRYTVNEFPVAKEYGRGLLLEKADGECRELQCGPSGVTCSCEGESYLSTAKANQRAHEVGDRVYPSYGCCHLDACVPLLKAGWFDLNPHPESVVV